MPCFNIKTHHLSMYCISIIKIWRCHRLIFIMGIPTLVRWHLYIGTGPWSRCVRRQAFSRCRAHYLITNLLYHDDVIKWKQLPRYWPFVRGILRSPVNSPHKGQWRRVLMISLIWAWTNGWANNRDTGYLRRHRAHYDVTVMTNECCHCPLTQAGDSKAVKISSVINGIKWCFINSLWTRDVIYIMIYLN